MKLIGYDRDLQEQMRLLATILKQNDVLYSVLQQAAGLSLRNYYIAGGCVQQTVWNYQVGDKPMSGISDIDFAYYDGDDLSAEAESAVVEWVQASMRANVKIDVKNEARVHMWHKDHFGYDIEPYSSVEDAIKNWLTTTSAIGVRLEGDKLKIFAPFGLNDLFGMIVRPNKTQVTEEVYRQKSEKWLRQWPYLTVIPW